MRNSTLFDSLTRKQKQSLVPGQTTNFEKVRPKKPRTPRALPNNPNQPFEHPVSLIFTINVKTENRLNQSLGYSKNAAFMDMRSRRMERQAAVDAAIVNGVPNLMPYQSANVTMSRGSFGKGLDSDGLGSALKHVRDGIADALGFNDDSDPRLTWRCQNVPAERKKYWVTVCVEILCRPEADLLGGGG